MGEPDQERLTSGDGMAQAAMKQNGNGGGAKATTEARSYQHANKDMPARPEIGAAAPRFPYSGKATDAH
jgi:hypothetical protein